MSLAFDVLCRFWNDQRLPWWIYYDLCTAEAEDLKEEVVMVAYECIQDDK